MIDDSDDALLYWLRLWAQWMKWQQIETGYPTTATGFDGAVSNFAVSADDAEDYYSTRLVPRVISCIDAAIDSLPPAQRRAIWHKYGLTKIDPEPSGGFAEAFSAVRVLVLARVAIAA